MTMSRPSPVASSSSRLASSSPRPPASPPHFEDRCASPPLDPRRRNAHKRLSGIADDLSELTLDAVKPAKMRRRNAIADVAHAAADIELVACKAGRDNRGEANGEEGCSQNDLGKEELQLLTVETLRRKRNLILLPSAMADLSIRTVKTPTRRRRPTATSTTTATSASNTTTSDVGSVASISLHRDLCRVVSSLHSVTSRLPHHGQLGQSPLGQVPRQSAHSHALVLYRPRPTLDEMDGLFFAADTQPRVAPMDTKCEDKIDT